MRKFKEAVNRILVRCLFLLWCVLGSFAIQAGESGYLFVEKAGDSTHLLGQANPKLLAPVGSLLKPFAAWYLLEHGVNPAQTVFCPIERKRSATMRCWTPEGHGVLNLQQALVHSCNYFFLSHFLGRNLKDYETWLKQQFDWPDDLPIAKPVNVYGFDLPHGIEAEKIVRMYNKLLQSAQTGDKSAVTITSGLREICMGTLTEFCRQMVTRPKFQLILGKTGTVQEGKKNFGSALLYLEYIPQNKKILLLCYEKNKVGSEAALSALKILDAYDRKNHNNNRLHR